MDEAIYLLGVKIRPVFLQNAFQKTCEFLNEAGSSLICFVDAQSCILAQDDQEYAKVISGADLILPADECIDKAIASLTLEQQEAFSRNEYFNELFKLLEEEAREVYIVTDRVRQLEEAILALQEKVPYLSVHGKALEDAKENHDLLANDINAVAPDILLLYIDAKVQCTFLQEYRNKINVGLFVCGNRAMEQVIWEMKKLPAIVEKMKMEKFYRWLNKSKKIHTTIINNTFMKRVKKESRKD